MRILYVSPIAPYPDNVGTVLRCNSLLTALESIGEVDCVYLTGDRALLESKFAGKHRVLSVLPAPDLTHHRFLGSVVRRIPAVEREWWISYMPGLRHFYSCQDTMRQDFNDLRPERYDLVFIVRLPTLWYLGWKNSATTIVDIDYSLHLGARASAASEPRALKRIAKTWQAMNLRRAELDSISGVAAALVCSDEDARSMGAANVHVVPNAFPERGQRSRPSASGDSKIVLFVGTLTYKPNRDAVQYFVDRMLPLIRAQEGDVVLEVAGRTAPGQSFAWARAPGVKFLGTVDDLAPIIGGCALEVCPAVDGLGTRIKVLEALSFAKPVVSTTLGAHGIPYGPDEGLYRVDDPEQFAATCINLIRDPANRQAVGSRGQARVFEDYGQETINRLVNDIVATVAKR